MSLSRLKIRRNAHWLLRLMALAIAFEGLLSGCHPCSIPGACEAPNTTEMVAFVGDDGAIYFDIPARKNYKRIQIEAISIYRVGVGKSSIPYWGVDTAYPTLPYLREEADIPLPLRYGREVPETNIRKRPKAIDNGSYWIEGAVWLYDGKGKEFSELVGRFRYKNGAVHNYVNE